MAKHEPMSAERACAEIAGVIEVVDQRCLVADGPVPPTRREITDAEMKRIYKLAKSGAASHPQGCTCRSTRVLSGDCPVPDHQRQYEEASRDDYGPIR